MKKIVKGLVMLGVLAGLMIPASVSAGRPKPSFLCMTTVTFPVPVVISVLVAPQAFPVFQAHGWACQFIPPVGGGDPGL